MITYNIADILRQFLHSHKTNIRYDSLGLNDKPLA